MKMTEVSKIAKALSEPKRLEIMSLTLGNELCANEILEEFNITQPTLSHHMKQLTECNLINMRKDGKSSYYSLNNNKIQELIEFFEEYK